MKKTIIVLFPLLLVIVGMLLAYSNRGKFHQKDGWGITASQLDASSSLWSKIATESGLISIQEKDGVVTRMKEMLESKEPVGLVQETQLADGVVNFPFDKNNITLLQKEELIKTSYGIIHSLATGDWNEYRSARFPVSEYTLPSNPKLASYISKNIGETNIQTELSLELHEKWFEYTFSKTPYFNSIQLLSSNAFAFTKWNKPIMGFYAWDSVPQSAETKYIFETRGGYNFDRLQELQLNKTKEILLCQFCFLAEGNPADVVRPYRIDMFWCDEAKKWVPIFLIRAFAEYTDAGSAENKKQQTVRLLLF